MSNLERCSWKLVSPDKFVMGQVADRCGDIADVVVLRPNRKTDLFLCEQHVNEFIKHWGLHNEVEILCRCADEPWNEEEDLPGPEWPKKTGWNSPNGVDWDDV